MARYRLKRYLGMVFIGVVIIPAIVLSFLAIRAITHEEAYIEKQIEGTLSAEVTHVAAIVRSELAGIQAELGGTISIPAGDDPSVSFEDWRRASPLVDIPFLLSPTYKILWPALGPQAADEIKMSGELKAREEDRGSGEPAIEEKETLFLESQQAFLSDSEKTPVYENIAVAYKDEILEEQETAPREIAGVVGTTLLSGGGEEATRFFGADTLQTSVGQPVAQEQLSDEDRYAANRIGAGDETGPAGNMVSPDFKVRELSKERATLKLAAPEDLEDTARQPADAPIGITGGAKGEEASKQSAISRFVESESVRRKVYDKAEREGQQVLYRNVEMTDEARVRTTTEAEDLDSKTTEAPEPAVTDLKRPSEDLRTQAKAQEAPSEYAIADESPPPAPSRVPETETQPPETAPVPRGQGRIRSAFISEPLSFSEIIAGGERGIVPRIMDGTLQLLYWQRTGEGNIVGCLIDSLEFRERIIGSLPGIYSAVRILTVLDELGHPVIIPPGHEGRDWRRPFVAEEISEMLPRWEIAAYLTDPDIISSRAQVATSVMWILILILFVSIVGGGVLVVRSTYAEMRLAQQKTTFVANVSHELKTPLTSIRMFAEMLRDGRQPDRDKQRKYLDIMTAETERLTRLVNNVLDFSRMERGEKRYTMKEVDIAALASGVVESQRTRLEHNGFDVSFSKRTGPVTVRADEEALKQALVNLLSNAEKYSAETREIEVSVGQETGNAVIGVSDRGVGVPPAQAKMIFDEFYRVDDTLTSNAKGAGLGLTIARRILKDHGGDIRLRNREGGGSAFEIILPLAGGKS